MTWEAWQTWEVWQTYLTLPTAAGRRATGSDEARMYQGLLWMLT